MIQGNVSGGGVGIATAEANATANAQAIVKGWSEVESCGGCEAATDLLLKATTDTFVSALAKSETKVSRRCTI